MGPCQDFAQCTAAPVLAALRWSSCSLVPGQRQQQQTNVGHTSSHWPVVYFSGLGSQNTAKTAGLPTCVKEAADITENMKLLCRAPGPKWKLECLRSHAFALTLFLVPVLVFSHVLISLNPIFNAPTENGFHSWTPTLQERWGLWPAARHTRRLKFGCVPHCLELPTHMIYFSCPFFCSQRSIFSTSMFMDHRGISRGCLRAGSPWAIHLKGNGQCVDVYMKGLRDKRAFILIAAHIKQDSDSVFMPSGCEVKDFSPWGCHLNVPWATRWLPILQDGLKAERLIHLSDNYSKMSCSGAASGPRHSAPGL